MTGRESGQGRGKAIENSDKLPRGGDRYHLSEVRIYVMTLPVLKDVPCLYDGVLLVRLKLYDRETSSRDHHDVLQLEETREGTTAHSTPWVANDGDACR